MARYKPSNWKDRGMTYLWEEPVCRPGNRVRFRTHRGWVRDGDVMNVETHYSPREGMLKAYHIYSIRIDRWSRQQHVGTDHIYHVVQS